MKTSTAIEVEKPKPRRWRRILKRVILTLLALAIILIFGVFPYWVAWLATNARTRPMDRQLTTTPADLGAQYRDVDFQTADGVRISGWLLPSRGKRVTIVYSHGLFRSRRELLDRAVDLWRLGYGALLYDARNHGDSGPATTSLGYHERLDAQAAVRFLRDEAGTEDKIVLFGISMGAVTALLAAAETPEVAAVISDTAFLSFDDTLKHHVRMFLRLPAFPLANEIAFFIEQRADFDGSQLNALAAVKGLGDRPVMFITGEHDRRMPPDIARTLYEASQSQKRDLLLVDGPDTRIHGHAYQAAPKVYIDRVARFIDSGI